MQALCFVCYYHNDVDEDDKEIVCENCRIDLMVYDDGSTEVVTELVGDLYYV
jgi:hypothetical protein